MADNTDDFLVNNPSDINPLFTMKQDERLEEDNDTPFSPPDGIRDHIDDTYPQTDTNIDPQEHYDEGIEGASETNLSDSNDRIPDDPLLKDDAKRAPDDEREETRDN